MSAPKRVEIDGVVYVPLRDVLGKKQLASAGSRVSLKVAECVLSIWSLYNGYSVKDRGPSGLLLDILKEVAPGIAELVSEGQDPHDLLHQLFPDRMDAPADEGDDGP